MELCTQYGPIAGLWFDTVGVYINMLIFLTSKKYMI